MVSAHVPVLVHERASDAASSETCSDHRLVCSAPWRPRTNSSLCLNSQRHRAGLQVQGLGVPELHLQTLRGADAARHHPHLHEGREGLTLLSGGALPRGGPGAGPRWRPCLGLIAAYSATTLVTTLPPCSASPLAPPTEAAPGGVPPELLHQPRGGIQRTLPVPPPPRVLNCVSWAGLQSCFSPVFKGSSSTSLRFQGSPAAPQH